MKNVLFVSHSSALTGAELWLLETLRRLDRRAFVPSLVVPRPGPLAEAARSAGVETAVVPMKWWLTDKALVWRQPAAWAFNRGAVVRISAFAREQKVDLVFTNSAATFGGALAAKRAGLPHIWAVHEVLRGERPLLHYLRGGRVLVRLILARSARVIVNSALTAAAFPPSDKIVFVPNGIEVKPADPLRREAVRAELGSSGRGPVLAVVGTIYAGKGQREAIEAAALLTARIPELTLLIIGGVKDARYGRKLRDLVRERGLEGKVVFTGYRSDLSDLLGLVTLAVVPSVVESFGRAALEAMAAGVPVLAVRAGGLTEIIEPGRNGFLADSREPDVLAAAIADALGHPERFPSVVENGLRTVRERFSVECQMAGVERILADVLGGTMVVPPPMSADPRGPFFASRSGGRAGGERT
jgi:glycosyltransferase involved in cell wall biosynthesis